MANAASNSSPLRRPLDDIKVSLAAALECVWEEQSNKGTSVCHSNRLPYPRVVIEDDGRNISISMEPYLEDAIAAVLVDKATGEAREADSAERQQVAAINAISILLPSWKEGQVWVKNAIERSKSGYQSSVRTNNTTIWVRHVFRLTGGFPDCVGIILTTRKNLGRYYENFRPD